MDQAVKYLEDMQDDFDFRFKTLQSRGELCVYVRGFISVTFHYLVYKNLEYHTSHP